ncbi:MAG: restriction endonuclease [bacterium]|nr:restriction endonuclease [bacterium]
MQNLSLPALKQQAALFAHQLGQQPIPRLYGATDGKRVGTYVEQAFNEFLSVNFSFGQGNSASGIDFPELGVDLKVTSVRQPQSSSPFRAASQKVYGLGYHLLVMVYDKHDDPAVQAAFLQIQRAIFVDKDHTADYQTTSALLNLLRNGANLDDIDAFLEERNLPLEEIGRRELAQRILAEPPKLGFLTISNALQWRLQYTRALTASHSHDIGIENLLISGENDAS